MAQILRGSRAGESVPGSKGDLKNKLELHTGFKKVESSLTTQMLTEKSALQRFCMPERCQLWRLRRLLADRGGKTSGVCLGPAERERAAGRCWRRGKLPTARAFLNRSWSESPRQVARDKRPARSIIWLERWKQTMSTNSRCRSSRHTGGDVVRQLQHV